MNTRIISALLALGTIPWVGMAHAETANTKKRCAADISRVSVSHGTPPEIFGPVQRTLSSKAPNGFSFDVSSLDLELTIDPQTGQLSGTTKLSGTARQVVTSIKFGLAQGLTFKVDSATPLTVTQAPGQWGSQNHVITFSPPLAEGQAVSLDVSYSGTQVCKGLCANGSVELPFTMGYSGLPGIEVAGISTNMWGAKASLRIAVPNGWDVLSAGRALGSKPLGSQTAFDFDLTRKSGFVPLALFYKGKFTEAVVPNVVPKTTVYSTPELQATGDKFSAWLPKILPFFEKHGPGPLPSPHFRVAPLPKKHLSGFNTLDLSILSEQFLAEGDELFEETLAHEVSHQWWGGAVTPADTGVNLILTEGLATLTQHDYSALTHAPDHDFDEYLAYRHREVSVLEKYYHPNTAIYYPFPVSGNYFQGTLRDYVKPAAVLDQIRVVVGAEAFRKLLKTYTETCTTQCVLEDFRNLLDASSTRDLTGLFKALVYGSQRPEVTLGFEPSRRAEDGENWQTTVRLTSPGDAPLWLELKLRGEGASLARKLVQTTAAGTTTIDINTAFPVISVAPNPRHDAVIDSYSTVQGDLNFDAQVDGLDVLRCARWLGIINQITEEPTPGRSHFVGADLNFDPRCDTNGDGVLSVDDLATTLNSFGAVGNQPAR